MTEMSFASLSPTLLARKGGATPAMRRQSPLVSGAQAHQPASRENDPEDLGWNDLGESPAVTAPIPAPVEVANTNAKDENAPAQPFAALGEHARSTATEAVDETENVTPIRKGAPRLPRQVLRPEQPPVQTDTRQSERTMIAPKAKRTAFTLRLDPERHLKLRMACTLSGSSAQALVTQAVDAMFADIPELDQLVARIAARAQSHPSQEG